ncbi:hypothetical protein F0U61_18120 [Archangium violaceum]|uniref:hypothetical protein n=1 Tax=Archangium violaceum TaxID=83451 RepID=UPI002B2BC75C|nr:hypothetical protein F0U61_18120 [Archangium violaceum]
MSTTAALALVLELLAARPAPRDTAPRLSANVDVTGDGRPEKLSLEPVSTSRFRLTVGKAQVEAELTGVRGFTVIDLDASDKRREVLVHAESQGLARYRLFRWENQALQELPLPPGTPSASGNGFLLCDVPVNGWLRRDKYVYDASKPSFTEVPQALYAVGKELEARSGLPLRMPPGEEWRLESGSRFTLLAFKPAPDAPRETDAGGWYLVQPPPNSRGPMGWASAVAVAEAMKPDGQRPPSGPSTVEPGLTLTYVGVSAGVSQSFPLQLLPTLDSPVVAHLREGSIPTLLAASGSWYLLQSETRLLGWARQETLKERLSALRKGRSRDVHASQLFLLQMQVMNRSPPSLKGLVVSHTYASSFDTWHICADGRATFDEYYYDQEQHGTWTLEGEVLHIQYTRKTGQRGVGEPLSGFNDNMEHYARYKSYDEPTSGGDILDLGKVVRQEGEFEYYVLEDKEPSCARP